MRTDARLLDLIGNLYEVAGAAALWPGWLTRLCHSVRADAAALVFGFESGVGNRGFIGVGRGQSKAGSVADSASPTRRFPAAADPCIGALAEDPRLFSRAMALTTGDLLVVSEVLPEHEFVATRFHRECLAPRDLHHVVCLALDRNAEQLSSLSLMRRPDRPRFGRAELDLLRHLHPHFRRVVRLQETLAAAKQMNEIADQVLESVRCGAILLDAWGRFARANRRATALLERGEGVALERAQLRAEDPRETAALRRVVGDAIACGETRAGGVVALSRAARQHALVASVTPLNGHDGAATSRACARALVLLSDPDDLPLLPEAVLCELHGLTQAEARVAVRVSRGETVEEISTALGVGRTTVRTQLQQALVKTGTHRQIELARLLWSGPHRCESHDGRANAVQQRRGAVS